MAIESILKKLTDEVVKLRQAIEDVGVPTSKETDTAPTEPAPSEPTDPETVPEAEVPAPTQAEVSKAILAFAKANGREAALAILQANGAKKVGELDKSAYAAVIEATQ